MSSVIELHDEENFNNDVLNSDVPVLEDFWAEWCGPCKQLSPTVEEIAEENKDKIKVDSFKKYSQKIIKILEKKESSLAEIDQQINLENKEILKNIINYLFDNDIINKFGDKYIINNNKKFKNFNHLMVL